MIPQRPSEREIVSQLVAIRKARGLTAQEVADFAGLSRPAVSILENGHRGPLLDTVLRYAAAVGAELQAQETQ